MPFHVRLGKLHEMRVKLCPNNLEGAGGLYVARTGNEATLTREDILASMRERGGFAGNTEDFLANLNRFFDEVAYQACDGFAVSRGPVTVYAKVNGPFDSERELITPETRPMSFHARVNDELRKLIPCIDGRIDGLADSGAYIESFLDVATGKVNLVCAKGGAFVIAGGKRKIVFDPDVPQDEKNTGVFFYAPGSPAISVKVSGNLIENTPTRISGIIPELAAGKTWYLEIRTRYSPSAALLKEIRVIRSAFTLQQA